VGAVLPIIILAVIVVPLLVVAFVGARRKTRAGEHVSNETAADRARNEREFAEADRYDEEWREAQHEEQHKHPPTA
jgi:uncharacterized membrane protein